MSSVEGGALIDESLREDIYHFLQIPPRCQHSSLGEVKSLLLCQFPQVYFILTEPRSTQMPTYSLSRSQKPFTMPIPTGLFHLN